MKSFTLESFNLLVGLSGAGKTRTLKALDACRRAALGQHHSLYGTDWELDIVLPDGRVATWSAKTRSEDAKVRRPSLFSLAEGVERPKVHFEKERLRIGDDVLVDRDGSSMSFQGKSLPRLKDTISVISLLEDEESVAPINEAFKRVIMSKAATLSDDWQPAFARGTESGCDTLDILRSDEKLSPVAKAHYMQREFPKDFARISEAYVEIFDTVEDVKFAPLSDLGGTEGLPTAFEASILSWAIKEKGVEGWIPRDRMSSGMIRVLLHLMELALAPSGSVLLVDEYENSLGVNCLPSLTQHVLSRSSDIQFVMTSHHPYVINNIPVKYWRVVTREGGQVTVRDASQIPGLTSGSHQEAFIRLMNSRAVEKGIV